MTIYVNDDAYPFTTVAFVTARFGDKWVSGSGVLVGRNDVLTASHVIYDPLYGLADETVVYFSYDPGEFNVSYSGVYYEYYTSFDPDGDGQLYAGDGIRSSLAGSELDIALITLSAVPGDSLGWMGMDFTFDSGYADVTGHPGLYSDYMTSDYGLVWQHGVDYYIDTSGLEINPGNSGGPIWYDYGQGPYVIGVVSTGIAAASLGGHEWLLESIAGNDRFITGGLPVFEGGSGDDRFVAAPTGGSYFGYGGIDTIVMGGRRAEFVTDVAADGETVTITGPGSSYRLADMERAVFADGVLLFGEDSPNLDFTYRIYAAAYGRTPDEGGLLFWTGVLDQLDAGQPWLDKEQFLAGEFLEADEYIALYGRNPSDVDYIDAMYRNVLGRLPDQTGYDYWVGAMRAGLDRADILINFSESDENVTRTLPDLSDGVWVV